MVNSDMPLEDLLKHLEVLANDALLLWDLPVGAVAKLINVSENATYIVEASRGYKAILRVPLKSYVRLRAKEEHTNESAYIRYLIVEDRKRNLNNGQGSLGLK